VAYLRSVNRWGGETETCRLSECIHLCFGGCRTSISRWPYVGGKPLDLYTLYTSVIKLGGWEKVRYPLCDTD